jgi:hypothetical protein
MGWTLSLGMARFSTAGRLRGSRIMHERSGAAAAKA